MVETPARQLGTGGPRLSCNDELAVLLDIKSGNEYGSGRGRGEGSASRPSMGRMYNGTCAAPAVPVPFSSAICHLPSAQARAGRRRRGEGAVVEGRPRRWAAGLWDAFVRVGLALHQFPHGQVGENPTAVSFPDGTPRLGLLGGRIAGHGPMARYRRHRVDSTQKINKQTKK